jgi:AraC-like DNA-binding protein
MSESLSFGEVADPVLAAGLQVWPQAYSLFQPGINDQGLQTWSFNRTLPVDVLPMSIDDGGEIRPNRHNYFELVVGCSGTTVFEIGRSRYLVAPGDLLVIGSSLYHRPLRTRGVPSKLAVLIFESDALGSGGSSLEQAYYLGPLAAQGEDFERLVPAKSRIPYKVLQLMWEIKSELGTGNPVADLHIRTCLKMILSLLAKHYFCMSPSEAIYQQQEGLLRLRPLLDYIDREYKEPLSLDGAASIVHMSRSCFTRLFKHVMGRTFACYLTQIRIQRAQSLLVITEQQIGEVSWNVGFSDQSHFSAVFRHALNMTPLQYRQEARKKIVKTAD